MRRESRPKMNAFILAGICLAAMASLAEAQPPTTGHDSGWLQAATERAAVFGEARNVVGGQTAGPADKKGDSVLNGVLIGAGVGALLGLIPDYYDDCEECHDSLYVSTAVGAGIGLLVDALRRDRQPTNPSISRVPVRVDLGVKRRGVGLRTILRWP